MSKTFNTPVNVWLDMEMARLFEWVMIADQMLAEAKQTTQQIGPGL
jgi:hypothetical protein